MLVAAVVLIVAWGALAFGSVYSWAFTPLLIACALVGAAGLYIGRHRPVDRPLVVCLVALAAAVAVQLVPLPAAVLRLVSPSTDAFLRAHDLAYALGDGSHALSINPEKTLLGLGFVGSLGIFLAGLVRSVTAARARQLAVSLVAFGVLLALIGIIQKALLGDHVFAGMKIYGFWSPESRLTTPFGPFVNKNHFAGWMLMVIPLGIALALGAAENAGLSLQRGLRGMLVWLSTPEGGRLQLLAVATMLMAASLLLTKSRSGLGCLIVLLVASGFAAARRFESGVGRWLTLGGLVAIFLGVFAWAGADVAARVGHEMSAVDLRKNIWTDSARVVRDFPVAGTGLNTFGYCDAQIPDRCRTAALSGSAQRLCSDPRRGWIAAGDPGDRHRSCSDYEDQAAHRGFPGRPNGLLVANGGGGRAPGDRGSVSRRVQPADAGQRRPLRRSGSNCHSLSRSEFRRIRTKAA